jgi:gluconolactonase
LRSPSIDEKGRIYFTDSRYLGHEPVEQPSPAVYRVDINGSVHCIAANVGTVNGVVVSPDQKRLYVGTFANGTMEFMVAEAEKDQTATPTL